MRQDEESNLEQNGNQEYISEQEAREVKRLFRKCLASYEEKNASVTDEEWLRQLMESEFPERKSEEHREDAEEIVKAVQVFNDNLESVSEAAQRGISKESWLADQIQKASTGMAVEEYGQKLQAMDNILMKKNLELEKALYVSASGEAGHINRNPNLDGMLAEHMIAGTTELSGAALGKNIRVDVLESHNANSVDVRAVNLDTGHYQNYQLKFGKDAKTTIGYIEKGNYANQRIIVPTEQLEEVQAHFREKGSQKTISDHIEAWGCEGKKYTKEDMKLLQKQAQEDGIVPEFDYSHYQPRDLALSIGKSAGAMAFQTAAVTTGFHMARRIFEGEKIEADELVEAAFRTGADTSVKVVAAGTLQVAVRKGIIKFLPRTLEGSFIANIACVGIENAKVLARIASGELSPAKGLDQMGRVSVSMAGGLWAMAKGAKAAGVALAAWVPAAGPVIAVAAGFVGGMVGYFGGTKLGDAVYNGAKKIYGTAKKAAKAAVEKLKSVREKIKDRIHNRRKVFA